MMDCVIPGGIAADVAPDGPEAILRALADLAHGLPELERLYDRGPLAPRLSGIGVVSASQASSLAAGGVIGRASGRAFDVRRFPGYAPYASLALSVPVLAAGDADARTRLRLTEIGESIRLLRALLEALPPGPVSIPLPADSGEGVGFAESRPRRRLALAAAGPRPDRQRVHARSGLGALAAPRGDRAGCPDGRSAAHPGLVRPRQFGSGSMTTWDILGRIARTLRDGSAAEPPAPVDAETAASLAGRLEAASRARLGRSLAIRHIDAGSCGGCEIEVRALTNVIHDLERFGLTFVTSPRHADVLLVTGPLTRNLIEALEQAWTATPEPKFVVAVGDCAVDGGVFKGSYAIAGGVGTTLPVDLLISGCPPTPERILAGLRALLEANARS